MSVRCKYNLYLLAEETISLSEDLISNPTVTHQITVSHGTYSASSTVPVSQAWSDTRTLTAGADALDLTALVQAARTNINFNTLKVQAVKIKASANNSAVVVFAPSGTNGYNLFGNADGTIALPPGAEALMLFKEGLADVSATVKAVAITSADTDASYSIILVAG
jgi:hypothetical protein